MAGYWTLGDEGMGRREEAERWTQAMRAVAENSNAERMAKSEKRRAAEEVMRRETARAAAEKAALAVERERLERERANEQRLVQARAEHEHWARKETERLERDRVDADSEDRAAVLRALPDTYFITASNARRMFDGIDRSKLWGQRTDGIYSADLAPALTTNEREWLAAARMLYTDFSLFVSRVYSRQKARDTKTFVREGTPPAYHSDRRCDRLLADYENFYLPPEIVARGDVEVERFREWFHDNKYLIETKPDVFALRAKSKFGLKNAHQLERIEKGNSGVELIWNLNTDTLNARIGEALREAEILRRSAATDIGVYESIWPRNADDWASNEAVQKWDGLKKEIKRSLLVYFQIRFNPELRFEGHLLEQVGFRPCSHCAQRRDEFARN